MVFEMLMDETYDVFRDIESFWVDEEYAVISAFTFVRAVDVVREIMRNGYDTPSYIDPGSDGGIYLTWNYPHYELSMSIPADKSNPITAYGDCRNPESFAGYELHASMYKE